MIRRTNAYIVFADDAPGQPIIGVGLAGETVTDTDLADLRGQVTLRSLAIRSNRVTDAGLAYLAGLTNLEELILTSSRIVGDGLVHLRGLTRLRKLTLPSHPLPSRALAHLSGLNRLEDLDMADGGSAAITLYAMLPNLRRIDVGRVGNAELLRLATLSTVTDLRFQTATEKVDAWGLAGLAGMTGLRQLRIDGGIDDHGLAELIRRADTLESLEVTHAIALTDDGVKALAELLLLRRLALPGSRISNAGLARLAAASRLTDLDLSGSRVTDAGLSVLRPSRLRRLNLADTDLTDAALPHLAELPNLEWVSVRGTRITPSGLATLRAAAPGLATDPPPPRSRTEAE
jgi:Leucine-rich repeat (LRR) protein